MPSTNQHEFASVYPQYIKEEKKTHREIFSNLASSLAGTPTPQQELEPPDTACPTLEFWCSPGTAMNTNLWWNGSETNINPGHNHLQTVLVYWARRWECMQGKEFQTFRRFLGFQVWVDGTADGYAGDTEDTSVLLVDTEDSSSPMGFLPQNRVVSMQLRNCEETREEELNYFLVTQRWALLQTGHTCLFSST